jgi:hypothetical protein
VLSRSTSAPKKARPGAPVLCGRGRMRRGGREQSEAGAACHGASGTSRTSPHRVVPRCSSTLMRRHTTHTSAPSRPIQYPWIYNKTENLEPTDVASDSPFTHVITESGWELFRNQ